MSYKSEKRRIEQAFIFIQLRFVIKYAIDFKEESTREEKLKIVEDQIIEILEALIKKGHKVSVDTEWSLGRMTAASKNGEILKAAANPRFMQGYAIGR